jgi:hypothetical protein
VVHQLVLQQRLEAAVRAAMPGVFDDVVLSLFGSERDAGR